MISVHRLDLNDARLMLSAAQEKAREIGVPMCIAITDDAGNLIAFERMDGGKVTSTTIAIDKSYTASGAKKATHEYGEASQPGKPAYGIAAAIGGRLMGVGGGLPVTGDGACVGGSGVSSGTPAQEMEVAQAGLDAFMATL
jgi:uncharacterized protein GlcG (DUF336 family)